MLQVFYWLIAVELIGLAAFPILWLLLPKFSDRGYGQSKTLGILLLAYVAWILSVTGALPSSEAVLIGLLLTLAAVSSWLVYRNRDEMLAFVRRRWRLLAFIEIAFLVVFLGWALFRAYDPAIDHTEQPMDFAFLNASIESNFGHPEDPWLRGESISYYYFGYWMMGVISELSGVESSVSYNLSLALIPALAVAGIVSLVVSAVRADGGRFRLAAVSGLFAAGMLVFAANLAGVLEFMRANSIGSQSLYDWIAIDGLDGPAETAAEGWTPSETWWWFKATRVINTLEDGEWIDHTIEEFPFFSFMLGDLHPHVMAIPFALAFAAFAFHWLRDDLDLRDVVGVRAVRLWGTVLAMALSLGGLAFTNMWDLPTGAAVLLGATALRAYRGNESAPRFWFRWNAFGPPLLVIALAVLLYLPYYFIFTASVNGIGAVNTTTRYMHMFVFWGPLLAVVIPFVFASFWQTVMGADWRRAALLSLAVAFLPFVVWMVVRLQHADVEGSSSGRLLHIMPLALLVGMSIWASIHEASGRNSRKGRAFALMAAALGLLLIMGVELLFVDDYFGGENERMNTVFKLYYQAWLLLSVSAGFALYYWLDTRSSLVGRARLLSTLWAVAAVSLILCGLYYTAAAPVDKAAHFRASPSLDGLGYVHSRSPAEWQAIQFVRENIPAGEGILESVGEWGDAGLISRSTGVATVFNWPGHQLQWRGMGWVAGGRGDDIARIYSSLDAAEAKALLDEYEVGYVYIGPRERSAHPGPGLDKFAEIADIVFQQDEVTIYEVR